MGQVSNMPVVLIEGDRNEPDKTHVKSFDWDELKDFHGGGTLGTRGMKTSGNETYEPPFRASIVISQNAAVSASEAILTRIVKLHFKRPTVTTESRIAVDNLNQIPVERLSHFMLMAARAEVKVLAKFRECMRVHEHELRLNPELRVERIIKNHAQMMALVDCLTLLCPLQVEQVSVTHQQLRDLAAERQRAIGADHPLVAEFWEVFEYLENAGGGPLLNHSINPKIIAINLNEVAERASEHRQSLADLKTLRALLIDCRSRQLLETNKHIYSAVRASQAASNVMDRKPTTVRCWIFKRTTAHA